MKTSRKGVALPVETLVLLAIAIIVLLSIVAWFVGTFSAGTAGQTESQQFQNCCSKYVTAGCPGDASTWPGTSVCGYNDVNRNGAKDGTDADWTLGTLAARLGITQDSASIKKACNCPST